MVSCGTLSVIAPFDPEQVSIADCSLSPQDLVSGESATVQWTIANNNDGETAEVTVTVTANGMQLHQQTQTVPAGGSTSGSTTIGTNLGPGDHQIEVNVASAASAAPSSIDGLSRVGEASRADGGVEMSGCSTCGH